MTVFCQCGCGLTVGLAKVNRTARGWVKGQPMNVVAGHKVPRPVAPRFWAKVNKSDGCWLWTSSTTRHGYGRFNFGRSSGKTRVVTASRVAWELTHGPIPDGLSVLHRCDNPPCVNPDHLFLGTQADNNRDAAAKGRFNTPACVERSRRSSVIARVAARAKCPGLTPEQLEEVRELRRTARLTYRALATMFGVSQTTAFCAVKGRQ